MSLEALRKDLKEGNRFWPNKEDLAGGGDDCEGDECKDKECGGDSCSVDDDDDCHW